MSVGISKPLAAGLLVIVAALHFGHRLERIKGEDAYRTAVALALESDELRQLLGPELRVGAFPTGSIAGDEEEARFAFRIHGPQGRARVEISLLRQVIAWRVLNARVVTDAGERRVLVSTDRARVMRARALARAAYALHINGRHAEAVEEFTRAAELDSLEANTFFWRGWAYSAMREYASAAADFARTVALDPEYAAAHYGLGLSHGQQDDYEPSVAHLTRAIELDPEEALYRHARAVAWKGLGRIDESRRDLEIACELGRAVACAERKRLGAS